MKKLLTALALLTISACATPYQKSGFLGGFTETQLNENVFQIRFRGNGFVNGEKNTDFTMLRSAEITLEHGYNYFETVEKKRSVVPYAGAYGNFTGVYYDTIQIICYKKKPKGKEMVLDAKFIKDSIRAKYELDKESQAIKG